MAAAVAARYGTNGDLWRERAQLPSRPVRVYEIWNEPQLVGAWCPGPQPEIYARYFVVGATAIKAADPGAQVVTGGIGHVAANRNPPSFLPPELFLSRAIAAQPRLLELADAVSVHAYPGPSRSQQLERVASLRGALRAGGVPDSMPMRIGEIGWHTRDSRSAISEAERAEAYRTLTRVLPRTNCNVSAILQHSWVSHQVGGRRDTWFGIVRPRTTVPYESAVAYAEGIALMTGRTDQPPPTGTIECLP